MPIARPSKPSPSLLRTLEFLSTAERLKHVERRVHVSGAARPENSAEHSWHAALMALALAHHLPDGLDRDRAIRMLLIHDLVEVYAGDTFFYDTGRAKATQAAREERAARRLFGRLPGAAGREVRALWREFVAQRTAEARFAKACDSLQAVLQNVLADGHSWKRNKVSLQDIRQHKTKHFAHDPALHALFEHLLGIARRRRYTHEAA